MPARGHMRDSLISCSINLHCRVSCIWVLLTHWTLLFRIDKSSLGVSRIGVATPWDDCPYAKSNVNTFVRAHAYRVFLTSCVGINLHTRSENPIRTRLPQVLLQYGIAVVSCRHAIFTFFSLQRRKSSYSDQT